MKEIIAIWVAITGILIGLVVFSSFAKGQTKTKRCTIEYITVSEPFAGTCRKIREGEWICRLVVCKE